MVGFKRPSWATWNEVWHFGIRALFNGHLNCAFAVIWWNIENAFLICIGCLQEGIIIGHLDEGELANGVMNM